jgi:hypothetical protein
VHERLNSEAREGRADELRQRLGERHELSPVGVDGSGCWRWARSWRLRRVRRRGRGSPVGARSPTRRSG